jgi:hypothetical protein
MAGFRRVNDALSFIRTVTVGFGFEPNLLTPAHREADRALAGWCGRITAPPSPPVGNFAPP